jgi:hypothetical protein
MVKWEVLTRLKEVGGLGFTDTNLMNQCLLSRWIIKLERGDTDMCSSLLRRKYLKEKGFFCVTLAGASQFWRGLYEIKYICQQGLKYLMGNRRKIRFWYDVWLGECPLKIRFRRLFEISCDRITSEMRGLSPKIISGDSRRSENVQTHTNTPTIPNMKFKFKLLQIKCHVLGFTKDKAPKCASKDNQSFCGSVRLSHDKHTLFALEESEPPRTIYTCESQ